MGLLVPEALTERLRVSEHLYHLTALTIGGLAGLAAVAGLALLLHRRLRVPAVRAATSRSDRLVYPLPAVILLAGLLATASTVTNPYDYRLGVSVWFRSLFALEPDVGAMARAPFVHQLHALLGMALFAPALSHRTLTFATLAKPGGKIRRGWHAYTLVGTQCQCQGGVHAARRVRRQPPGTGARFPL